MLTSDIYFLGPTKESEHTRVWLEQDGVVVRDHTPRRPLSIEEALRLRDTNYRTATVVAWRGPRHDLRRDHDPDWGQDYRPSGARREWPPGVGLTPPGPVQKPLSKGRRKRRRG